LGLGELRSINTSNKTRQNRHELINIRKSRIRQNQGRFSPFTPGSRYQYKRAGTDSARAHTLLEGLPTPGRPVGKVGLAGNYRVRGTTSDPCQQT